ncbi:MAG: pyruvate, phosphate dikinase [Candidatus Bathyarchaeota archaeon]|nr:pyruvate, phosphate dikinase [Candidatus Bathyarchaeota archaeon]
MEQTSQSYAQPIPVQTKTAPKYVYLFQEGDGKDKKLLGGKGAGLCEMTKIGLPVPPGFVITTQACLEYFNNGYRFPKGLQDQVCTAMREVEKNMNLGFGNPEKPLLVSVRSGAAISMPGMMDTVLNLGINDYTVQGLIKRSGDERFGWDSYRRFLSLFGNIVLNIDDEKFHLAIEKLKEDKGITQDLDLTAQDMKQLVDTYKKIIQDNTGKPAPQDPYQQLFMAIEAVFASWNGKRAVDYRREFKITPKIANGTAATVQTMVFGNLGKNSATGVAFTRDPSTGENVLFGDYLDMAQGEDIVAGIRTPKPISEMRQTMPQMYDQLLKVRGTLETHFKEVQDMEFTIQEGKLYLLQTRNARMNAAANLKTSVDMVNEGLLTKEDALLRLNPTQLTQLMYCQIDPNNTITPVAKGLGASPGAASGEVVFDADEAERQAKAGKKVILVREQTKPEDIHGFFAAQGILTSIGGKTSHAAVVARGMGKPCVSGASDIKINHFEKNATVGSNKIVQGSIITIDGTSGNVWLGEIPMVEPEISQDMDTVLSWADEFRRLGVRANADTPADTEHALRFGAEGVGLCRTERMFNASDRIGLFQKMILADKPEERLEALQLLLPMQQKDFVEIFKAMEGFPVTIRLLDPPLHEFLPSEEAIEREIETLEKCQTALSNVCKLPEVLREIDPSLAPVLTEDEHVLSNLAQLQAAELKKKVEILQKIRTLREVNPMLGHRGVRLGITYPEIYEMQVQAILLAAGELIKQTVPVKVEIMIPQVCTSQELKRVYDMIRRVEKQVKDKIGINVPYTVGTMIEVVRACMRAGRLAEMAEFFSFGTNDLTQATFSFSREDAENKFLPFYNEHKILQDNPFEILDVKGVGRLMAITVEWGRRTRPDLKIGICGEHGGEPSSIEFCHRLNLDYVSCSPYRVPVARLAAAQANIKEKRGILKPFQ